MDDFTQSSPAGSTAPRSDSGPAVSFVSGPMRDRSQTTRFATGMSRMRMIIAGIATLLVAALLWMGLSWWMTWRFIVTTDDAYVQADTATLSTKVSGYIATVPVKDGQAVKSGDIVVTLEDRDYRLALEAAQAKRQTQAATIARIAQQIEAQKAQIASAKAALASAEAGAQRARANFARVEALAQQKVSSVATLDQATADRNQTSAAVANAQAQLRAAEETLGVIEAQKVEAENGARELDKAVEQAGVNLSYTVIRAPNDGVIGNRAAQPGQFVGPGARLMALVPRDSVYVVANFKETQMATLRPGLPVSVEVDLLNGQSLPGRVESIAPATGAVFSLLPPENATGNFTKITQRVPVRIAFDPHEPAVSLLRPGLSVVARVDTRGAATPSPKP